MLDLKLLRSETEKVKAALGRRKENVDIDAIIAVDDKRRALLYEVEGLKARMKDAKSEIICGAEYVSGKLCGKDKVYAKSR